MITVLSNEQRIKKLNRLFLEKFQENATDEIECKVGFRGGNQEGIAYYSSELDVWMFQGKKAMPRIWNAFGIGKPDTNGSNSIIVEINFPFDKIDRRIAGAFAKEENGNYLVLHRGKIGGGKPGIGKENFWDNYRGDSLSAIDGDKESEFCLVGELDSKLFVSQVANFIHEINRIKESILEVDFKNKDELSNFEYTDEQFGQIVTENSEPRTINRVHGIVVSALANLLEKKGYDVANDKNRDLFIHDGNSPKVLFEIKSNSSTQSIYSAVGQLLVYSIPMNDSVKLIAVLPNRLKARVKERLNSLGIEILYYSWENDEPKFSELEQYL